MLRERFPSLRDGEELALAAIAEMTDPPVDLGVDEWAERFRYVAPESGSARPGPWRNKTTPYAIKPMRVASPWHPARSVSVCAGAQMLKTELMLNTMFTIIATRPMPMMLVLPSIDEVLNWNRTKWRPNVLATPTINQVVTPERSRDATASTVNHKAFLGGYLVIAAAGSSKQLQARSSRYNFNDEITEFPDDTKGRGDPMDQARARQDAQDDDAKSLTASTPGEKPHCRITAAIEAGTLERYYVACPHCGWYQLLLFANFDAEAKEPTFTCPANGCVIDETSKFAMVQYGYEGAIAGAAEWLATFVSADPENPPPPACFPPEDLPKWLARPTEGRDPSFHIWQAYSTMKPWAKIAKQWRDAKGKPTKLKPFWQQVLAEPYEGTGEAPDHEKLLLRADRGRQLGSVPFGYWILTGAADVQGDRIEAGVWAWGPEGAGYLVAYEIIPGATQDENDDCWKKLGEFRGRMFPGDNGFFFPIDLFGVDAGFVSGNVYKFVNRRTGAFALDGRGDRFMAPLGVPKHIKAAPPRPGKKARPAALLYPVGTYGLKQELYQGLNATLDGPDHDGVWPIGAQRFPEEVTIDFVMQMTSESLVPVKKPGGVVHEWQKTPGRANEALDIWVYARALAHHLKVAAMKREDWEHLFAIRGGAGDGGGGGLARMWLAAGLKSAPEARPLSAPPNAAPTATKESWLGTQRLAARKGWLKQ